MHSLFAAIIQVCITVQALAQFDQFVVLVHLAIRARVVSVIYCILSMMYFISFDVILPNSQMKIMNICLIQNIVPRQHGILNTLYHHVL